MRSKVLKSCLAFAIALAASLGPVEFAHAQAAKGPSGLPLPRFVTLKSKRVNLRMDTPVSIGGGTGTGGGSRIVLPADSRGHFMTQGAINGRTVTFMLDTGATSIALSAADAQRIGLDYSKGQRVQMNTANGVSSGYKLRLQSVRVGDVEVYDVEAIVSPQPMPFVLLGNSFISRFSMRRDADQMVLEKRF